MRKNGFTLAEFTIAITIMLTVMAVVLPATFNKVKTDRKYVSRIDGEYYFTCNKTNLKNCSENSCAFKIEQNKKVEFAQITLIGGGGGQGLACKGASETCKGGTAGEVKKIIVPYLLGDYKIVLGEGGASGKNGAPTMLYKCNDAQCSDKKLELIAFAGGGISTNEGITPGSHDDKKGEITETGCGSGGGSNNNGKGVMGGVSITW